MYSGGICGGGNASGNINTTGTGEPGGDGGNYTFSICSVYTISGNIEIGGDTQDTTIILNYNCGGICGGGNGAGGYGLTPGTPGSGGIYTFNTCCVTSNSTLSLYDGNDGVICGSNNGTNTPYTYTINQCSVIVSTSITVNEIEPYTTNPSLNYITDYTSDKLMFLQSGGIYSTESIVILASNMTSIFTQSNNITFEGYNLSGTNLTNVDLSNYNLIGTTLSGANLSGVTYNNNTQITDSNAIAINIVKNSGTTLINNTYSLTDSVMTRYGMGALKNGLATSGKNVYGLSTFVNGLFTGLINTISNFLNTTKVIVPAKSLPSVNPWLSTTVDSTVELFNSSIYPLTFNNPTYTPVKTVDVKNINTTYVYILVQYLSDSVTIIDSSINNGNDKFIVSAINTLQYPPVDPLTFTCTTPSSTTVVSAGSSTPILFLGKSYYIGSASSQINPIPPIPPNPIPPNPIPPNPNPNPISNICFPAGTPIKTDQGLVKIEEINTSIHTINNHSIKHITQTVTLDKYLICFQPNTLGKNIPNKRTVMTKDHKILYNGQLVPAFRFLDLSSEIKKVNYSGEILYNVLLKDKHGVMNVNNLICETLHPENVVAKLYSSNYSVSYKNNVVILLNDTLIKKDFKSYKSIVDRLQF